MAKMTKPPADPFEALVRQETQVPEPAPEPKPKAPSKPKPKPKPKRPSILERAAVPEERQLKTVFSVSLPITLQDRVRDLAYWERTSVSELVHLCLERFMDQAEEERGEPYPPREGPLQRGPR